MKIFAFRFSQPCLLNGKYITVFRMVVNIGINSLTNAGHIQM